MGMVSRSNTDLVSLFSFNGMALHNDLGRDRDSKPCFKSAIFRLVESFNYDEQNHFSDVAFSKKKEQGFLLCAVTKVDSLRNIRL